MKIFFFAILAIVFVLILVLAKNVLTSENSEYKPFTPTGEDIFVLEIQEAYSDDDEVNYSSETTLEDAVEQFDTLPWQEQFAEVLTYPPDSGLASPTLSIEDHKTGKVIWFSVVDVTENGNSIFWVGYHYPEILREGRSDEEFVRWSEIFEIEDKEIVPNLLESFFERNYKNLENQLGTLTIVFPKKKESIPIATFLDGKGGYATWIERE